MFLLWLVITTLILCGVAYKPSHGRLLPVFGILYGLGIGGIQPIQRTFYLYIVPSGSEAEMFGIYVFFSQVLNFLPNLIFSLCNELFNSVRLAMVSLALFHLLGLGGVSLIDFGRGREAAGVNEHLRIKAGGGQVGPAKGKEREKVRGNTQGGMRGNGAEEESELEAVEGGGIELGPGTRRPKTIKTDRIPSRDDPGSYRET